MDCPAAHRKRETAWEQNRYLQARYYARLNNKRRLRGSPCATWAVVRFLVQRRLLEEHRHILTVELVVVMAKLAVHGNHALFFQKRNAVLFA